MLNREFSLRERLLLIACLVLGVAIFYYQVVHKGIKVQLDEMSTYLLQEEITKEQATASSIQKMNKIIESNANKEYGTIAVYNNLAAEISFIGSITNDALDVSLNWGNPVLRGTTVRRSVRVSFIARSYEGAKSILYNFAHCPFRCLIYDLTMADNNKDRVGLKDSEHINTTFTATFFETIEGATTTEGLVLEDVDTDPSDGKLVTRSKAYADNK